MTDSPAVLAPDTAAMEWRAEVPEAIPPARPEPCLITLFGATGDLVGGELVPSLFQLWMRDLLPERFAILGTARREMDDEGFRAHLEDRASRNEGFDRERWRKFSRHLYYAAADAAAPADDTQWRSFADRLRTLRQEHDVPGNTLFHLAVPPSFFDDIVTRLGALDETSPEHGWRRLAVEKPFGHDEASARELDGVVREHFDEDHIYRVDHFLGKETVQNLLVTRFANPGFEPIWNRNYVDHVQITVAESIGVGGRGAFYEGTGVVRDMLQNHVLQLVCMVAAEPPVKCIGSTFQDETVRILRSIRRPDPERDLVVGQYGPGRIDDRTVPGYREEDSVADGSTTATFAALRLELDSWRWAGVPFYVRTGKRLSRKATEVTVHFRPTPQMMFPDQTQFRSTLTFRLQPNEAVVHAIAAKRPGPGLAIQPVRMSFSYADAFGLERPPSAYAWLLHDALLGDRTLFARSDWVYRAWSLIDPLTERESAEPLPYAAGTWGPDAASTLLEQEGRRWMVT